MTVAHDILDALGDGPASPAAIAERTGRSNGVIRDAIFPLAMHGAVVRVERGLLALPPRRAPRPGLVRLPAHVPVEAHEDAARIGWPSEGAWCE